MAKKLSTQAQLKLSVSGALEQIKKLSSELKQVKEEAKKPVKLDVQIDTTNLDKQMNQIKQVLGGSRNAKGQFSTIASDIRAIRSELTSLSKVLKDVVGGVGDASKEANRFSTSMNKAFSGNGQIISGMGNEINQFNITLRKTSEEAQNTKDKLGGMVSAGLTGVSSLASALDNAYRSFRSVGTSFLSTIGNIANQAMDAVGFSVTGMVDEAMEQERKLQQSRIGFKNMFPGQDTNAMVSKIRSTAAASPGLNSGDLADYINQLGAVAGGNFNTAYNATLGILKTVQYGGGDAASQMNYIIKNVRDVMAKGKAAQVDIQQFNRAMPLLAKSMEAIGASEFLKDGQLTITKDNASKLMEAFANLNTEANPAYGIYAETGKTLAGIQEEFREATASTIATNLEELGFYDALADVMKGSVMPEIENDINQFFKWVGEVAKDIDWKELQKEIGSVASEIKVIVGEITTYLKDEFLNTDGLKLVIQLIGEFIKGLLDGAKWLLETINGVRQYLGDDGLKNLAGSLGRAVTQGWLLTKVLGAVASGFETASHVGQAMFFFGRNTGGNAAGGAANGLGFLSGSTANGSFASNVGEKVASTTGLRYTTITKGVALVGRGVNFAKKAAGGVLKGGAITMLTDVVSDVIKNFNLLGGASEGVANVLKVGGAAIGAAIMGNVLGPLGALGAGLVAAVFAINSIQFEEEKKKAEEAGAQVKGIKDAKGQEFLNRAIQNFRDSVDENGKKIGFTFDEQSDAAIFAKNEVIDYLNSLDAKDWDEEEIRNRLVRAYAQKLGHEYMVKADNKDGFWYIQGQKVEFTRKNDLGETEVTEYGHRLAEMIRAYNLVGYTGDNVLDQLTNTGDQTLVNQYLQQEELNLGQLEFLEEQARIFEEQTGTKITNTTTTITNKIAEYGGDINAAIEDAKKAGEDSWVEVLQSYKYLGELARSVREEIAGVANGNMFWDENTAKEFLGEEGAKRYIDWVNRTGLDSVGDFLGESATDFRNMFDTEGYHVSKSPAIVAKNLQEELLRLQANAENFDLPEVERAKDKAAADAIQNFLSNMPEAGDWDTLTRQAYQMVEKLVENNRGLDLLTQEGWTSTMINGHQISIEDTEIMLKELRKWLKDHGVEGYAKGGFIKPIYRASGGGASRGVDIVPAYLQPGEFVQPKTAVETAGIGVMQALRTGDLAQAYKLIGSKINGSWNNSRNDYSSRDNRRYQNNNFFIRNNSRSSRVGSGVSLSNRLALGY